MALAQSTATLLGGVGGGLVSGLLSLGGNRLQYKYNNKLQQQQFGNEQQLAKQAHLNTLEQQLNSADLQQRNWMNQFAAENGRQNDLLLNQKRMEVQAMKNAGLNPALAGGTVASTQVVNPSASAPSASASMGSAASASVTDPQLGDAFAKGMQSATNLMQAPYANENMKANTTLALAKAETENKSRDPYIKKMIQETAESQSREELNRENIKRIQTLTPLEANEILARTDLTKAEQRVIEAKLDPELKLLAAQATLAQETAYKERKQGELYEEQKKTEKTQQSYNLAAAANQKAQSGYYYQKALEVKENIKLIAHEIAKTKAEWALVERDLQNAILQGKDLSIAIERHSAISPKIRGYLDTLQQTMDVIFTPIRSVMGGGGAAAQGAASIIKAVK